MKQVRLNFLKIVEQREEPIYPNQCRK